MIHNHSILYATNRVPGEALEDSPSQSMRGYKTAPSQDIYLMERYRIVYTRTCAAYIPVANKRESAMARVRSMWGQRLRKKGIEEGVGRGRICYGQRQRPVVEGISAVAGAMCAVCDLLGLSLARRQRGRYLLMLTCSEIFEI